jgi:hypothetical protein
LAGRDAPRYIRHETASFTLEGRKIAVIGRAALIKNKRAAGRAQDLADIEAIEPKQD